MYDTLRSSRFLFFSALPKIFFSPFVSHPSQEGNPCGLRSSSFFGLLSSDRACLQWLWSVTTDLGERSVCIMISLFPAPSLSFFLTSSTWTRLMCPLLCPEWRRSANRSHRQVLSPLSNLFPSFFSSLFLCQLCSSRLCAHVEDFRTLDLIKDQRLRSSFNKVLYNEWNLEICAVGCV